MTDAHTMTLEELSARVEEVMETVQKTGRPVIVTDDGRFLAVVAPVEGSADE